MKKNLGAVPHNLPDWGKTELKPAINYVTEVVRISMPTWNKFMLSNIAYPKFAVELNICALLA